MVSASASAELWFILSICFHPAGLGKYEKGWAVPLQRKHLRTFCLTQIQWTHWLLLCLGIDWESKGASSLCIFLYGSWLVQALDGNYWLLDTLTHTYWILSLYLCLSPLSLSPSHCGPDLFSDKTSRLCVSAALAGKPSQLRIRRHGAPWLIGSGCHDHSFSVIDGATASLTSPKFTKAQRRPCILPGCQRIPWWRIESKHQSEETLDCSVNHKHYHLSRGGER